MRTHATLATLVPAFIVALLGLSSPAEAAEPDDPLRRITDETQRQRVADTQAFDIPVRPVETEAFALQMQERCDQYLSSTSFDKQETSELPRLSSQAKLGKDDLPARTLDVALGDNPTKEDKQAALTASHDYAKAILGSMVDYREACIAIEERRQLSDGQFRLLREIYGSDEYEAYFSWVYELHSAGGHDDLFDVLGTDDYDDAQPLLEDFAPPRGGGPPQGGLPGSSLSELAQRGFVGLAEFLLERGQQELLEYLQEQLVSRVCGADNDPILFIPRTCEALGDLDPSLSIASMGATLRGALVKDLELLPDRGVVLASTIVPDLAYPGTVVRALMPLVRDAGARSRPLDYAASFYAAPLVDCETIYAKARDTSSAQPAAASSAGPTTAAMVAEADKKCAQMMAILRLSSAVTSTSASMVPDAGIGAVPELPYFTLGLLFGLEERIATLHELGVDKTLLELLELHEDWWSAEARQFEAAVFSHAFELARVSSTAIQDVSAAIDSLSANGPVSANAVFSVTSRVVLSLSDITLELVELSPKAKTGLVPLTKGSAITREVLDLIEAYAVEDWSAAVLGTMNLVLDLAERHGAASDSGSGSKREVKAITAGLRRYLPLFIEIATAQSSDQVNAALEAAFPAGGYRRKFRENSFSLNAYLGAYGGATIANAFEGDTLTWGKIGGEFALFAPVGADFSWVARSKWKNSTVGLFVPLVDLGAITTAKWLEQERLDPVDISGGTTMATSETELSEPAVFNIAGVVAPGLYFRVGIAESPVTFGLGATVSPFAHKRTIARRDSVGDIESTSEKFLPAIRLGAFFAVDITFLSVGYNKR